MFMFKILFITARYSAILNAAPTAMRAFTQHSPCMRSSCKSDQSCGKAPAFNFPDTVNPADAVNGGDALIVRSDSHALIVRSDSYAFPPELNPSHLNLFACRIGLKL